MENEIKSKTQKKNEDKFLQRLGAQLTNLSFDQINQIDMPGELREALFLAQNITAHGARRRQIKHIGGLLRQIDTAPILRTLEVLHGGRWKFGK